MNEQREMKPHDVPIGYWLKRADALLTEQANRAQRSNEVTRFEWQTLNLVRERPGSTPALLAETMITFVDGPHLDAIIGRFLENGWIERETDGGFRLTDRGEQKHHEVFNAQQDVRRRAMEGISEEEYATVLSVLQRLVSNLEEGTGTQLSN